MRTHDHKGDITSVRQCQIHLLRWADANGVTWQHLKKDRSGRHCSAALRAAAMAHASKAGYSISDIADALALTKRFVYQALNAHWKRERDNEFNKLTDGSGGAAGEG